MLELPFAENGDHGWGTATATCFRNEIEAKEQSLSPRFRKQTISSRLPAIWQANREFHEDSPL